MPAKIGFEALDWNAAEDVDTSISGARKETFAGKAWKRLLQISDGNRMT